MILFFAKINRHRNQHQDTFVSTAQFLVGYLTVWTGFSVLATLTQWGLLTVALVSPMMETTRKALGGGLLLGSRVPFCLIGGQRLGMELDPPNHTGIE